MRNTLTIENEKTGGVITFTSEDSKIEDFLQFVCKEISKPKKIELVECLQTNTGTWLNWEGNYKLSDYSKFKLNDNYKIRDMDLIYATTITGNQQIWLGHWNEGEV